MKLLIAVDMEGITGVTHFDQTTPGHSEWQRFRRLMTADVNAAIQGAAEAGVEDIVVSDGHWDSTNILIEELDRRARLNSGSPSPFSMVQGIDNGVNAVFFIGYHARIGTQNAILDHTWSSARVSNIWLNGRVVGETGLNGSVCGHFGAPVLLISGDQSVCAEAKEWIPGIETVIVKQAVGRNSAECLPPEVTHPMIKTAAKNSILRLQTGKGPGPLHTVTPVKIVIEFIYSDMADRTFMMPGATRLDGKRVEIQANNMAEAYLACRGLIAIANR
jgi:D-amino peptidase